ncbi:2OG-Fe(II) oxygenase [Chondromyces crocatus]|uniref:2OG-Fe(II) oxygenase n=1 Tax=Chondromyces crocatus TaxID=52 RepID=A0A0K1EJD0_CHOCO|nr:2OG-Fe(II) oxygenase [Chondromyces crocatus]AKT40688.1 2OG-Fe(II) oxygenase [Chondromyces crocatus]
MGMYAGHYDFTHPLIWTVPALYTAAECAELLSGVPDEAWIPSTVNSASGRVVDKRIRNNLLAVLRKPAISEELYRRVLPHVPRQMKAEVHGRSLVPMEVVGVHVPARIYRYDVGQHFGLHQDQSYFRDDGAKSLLTLMVYLNEGFEGGATTFPEQQRTIVPRTGTALLFQHMVLHAGESVTRGTKYVLRSDVLYRPSN